jgi:hypothetical protein
MKHGRFASGIIASLAAGAAMASSPDNPYRIIAEKNAFRLNPPPVPVVVTNAPPEEKTNLRFTGLSWDGPAVSAWLAIDSLEPGGTSTYLALAKGEKASGVEILGIDEATQKVKVQYRDKPLTLSMDTASAPAGPAGRTIPGLPAVPRGVRPTAAIPGLNSGLNSSAVANPTGGASRSFNSRIPNPPAQQNNNNFRSIPQRTVRGGSTGASSGYGSGGVANPSPLSNPVNSGNPTAGGSRPLTLEESTIAVEVQRAVQPPNFPPLPPTVLSH